MRRISEDDDSEEPDEETILQQVRKRTRDAETTARLEKLRGELTFAALMADIVPGKLYSEDPNR